MAAAGEGKVEMVAMAAGQEARVVTVVMAVGRVGRVGREAVREGTAQLRSRDWAVAAMVAVSCSAEDEFSP